MATQMLHVVIQPHSAISRWLTSQSFFTWLLDSALDCLFGRERIHVRPIRVVMATRMPSNILYLSNQDSLSLLGGYTNEDHFCSSCHGNQNPVQPRQPTSPTLATKTRCHYLVVTPIKTTFAVVVMATKILSNLGNQHPLP